MSEYVEYGNKIAFHPGYYIKEYMEYYGMTQEDIANRLDITPKDIGNIIRGEQNISVDIANKLSKMMSSTVQYWLNLQNEYDGFELNLNKKIIK